MEKQKDLFKQQALKEGKSKNILEKILAGRFERWFEEICLLDQKFFHPDNQDEAATVQEALAELTSQVREKIAIRRFVRYELGQDSQ